MNRAAEIMAYKNWGDDFCARQIREIPEKLIPKLGTVNIEDLTKEQMEDLGFGKWSEENPMMLIPLWLFPFLPEDIEAGCIDGEKRVFKKSDMDTDNRYGCLAYGIFPKS